MSVLKAGGISLSMNIKRIFAGLALVFISISFVPTASTQSNGRINTRTRDSLRGLKKLQVVIENNALAEQEGLTVMQLQTDVGSQISKAGVRVLTEKEALRGLGKPTLYLKLLLIKSASEYTFLVDVQFREQVKPKRYSSLSIMAATWQSSVVGSFGSINPHVAPQVIREGIGSMIDLFIKDYLAVNPK